MRRLIEELFEKVRKVMNRHGVPWEIIFVNDGSLDKSEEILDRLATLHPEVKVVHFRRNFGQTAAMMAGFDFASGDVIIPMDGDGQNDPEDIPRMLAKIDEGYDVCSGWRRDRQDKAIQRNIPSILANKLISAVSGVRLHDFGCSLKAYRAEVLEGIRLYGEMHRFLPDLGTEQGNDAHDEADRPAHSTHGLPEGTTPTRGPPVTRATKPSWAWRSHPATARSCSSNVPRASCSTTTSSWSNDRCPSWPMARR